MRKIAVIVLCLVFLAVFNLLFFIITGTDNTISTWISYGFIHLSYLCVLATPLFCRKNDGESVLTMTLYTETFRYFLLELLVGVILLPINFDNYIWSLIIQALGFAWFVVRFCIHLMANESTIQSRKADTYNSQFIKNAAAKLSRLLDNTLGETRKKVSRCYDYVSCSPIASHPEAAGIEMALLADIESLCVAVEENDDTLITKRTQSIIQKIDERNRLIKLNINH